MQGIKTSFKIESKFLVIALICLFVSFHYQEVLTPWIHGMDSVTRLLFIDKTIVVLKGNPWLPALQVIMQIVNFFADYPQLYKAVNFCIGILGMFICFLLVSEYLGGASLLIFSLYFFLHLQWIGMVTSIYMEPLAIMSLASCLYFHLKGKKNTSAIFFILASFSRPEVLIALPAILIAHYYYYRDQKRVIKFSFLFIPVILYYLIIKLTLPAFHNPMRYEFSETVRLLWMLTEVFRNRWEFSIILVLGIGGIWSILFDKDFLPNLRKCFLAFLIGALIFYFCFLFLLPFAHRPGGTRISILLTLPMSLFAGVFVRYLLEKFGYIVRVSAYILFALLIVNKIANYRIYPPRAYLHAVKIDSDLKKSSYKNGSLYICIPDSTKVKQTVFEGDFRDILLHLRFLNWPYKTISCAENSIDWKVIEKRKKIPILKIYDKFFTDKNYLELLTKNCSYYQNIKDKRSKVVGNLCY